MQSIAAMAVISILGLTTYATVTKNPILEKLGLIKGSTTYEEVAKEINEDISNDYAQITLKRMASDNAYIIMEYNINLKEKGIEEFGDIEKDTFSGYNISIINKIIINNDEIDRAFNTTEYVNKISNTEYDVYQIIQIANIDSQKLKIEISEEYLIANNKQTLINKEVIIDATKNENTEGFKKIEKKVENKTITVESFQNITFETFIKISVDITKITKNDLDSFYSEKNPNNISFTILDKNNNYIPHFCYMKKSFVEDDKGNKIDILSSYDENNNISYENAKSHLEYIITLGDIDKEISELKIIPYISILPDERGEDYEDYYNKLEWHKLESGEYKQKNTLGGELELTKMEVDNEKIKFAYDLRGFITGREDMVLLRIKDDKLGFNAIYPTNTYIKKINNQENISEFYRNIENVGIYSYNFEDEEDFKLNDISKIEFALLVEPTIKLLDSDIELVIPEEDKNCLTINNVEVKELPNDITDMDKKEVINTIVSLPQNNNNFINDIENNTTPQENIEKSSKEKRFGKNDNKIGKITLGMTESEVKSILGEPLNIIDSRNTDYINKLIYEYAEEIMVSFKKENGKYLVHQINTYKVGDSGPRGINIGDKKEDVIKKFYAKENISIDEMFVELYRFNGSEYYGEITKTEEEQYIEYCGDRMILYIYLDENGVVKGMDLGEILD